MPEQPALDADLETFGARAHEAADRAVGADHAMARHYDGNGVRATRSPHRPRRGAELERELAIRARAAGCDPLHRLPHLQPVMRARKRERQVEAIVRVLEVRLQLDAGEVGERAAPRSL